MRFPLKAVLFFTLLSLSTGLMAASRFVFVSFSMPEPLLIQTLQDATRLHIPAVLNGLHHNSMKETAEQLMKLPFGLQVQIDPTAFERFDIQHVPALVVEHTKCFDVIYGHLPLAEGLERIARHGTCHKESL